MADIEPTKDPNNSFVFMDIEITHSYLGRMIIELRNDLAPNSLENFQRLYTSVKEANGKPFVYKGTITDELQQLYMVPKGHIIIINDETNGASIYRSHFDDVENLTTQNEDVQMMDIDRLNQPSDRAHCDIPNAVLGKLLKNVDCLREMESWAFKRTFLSVDILIRDCGEIASSEYWKWIPMEMLRYITAPSQDSPLHIVNALNDYCLQHVFKYLNMLELSDVADVCVRFRQNAQATFITKYKHKVEVEDTVGPADGFESILRNFGQSIHFLEIFSRLHGIIDIKTLQMVNQHATALKSLFLCRFVLTENMINVRSLFEKLDTLELVYCQLQNGSEKLLAACTELKVLRMHANDFEDNSIGITFPNVEEIWLHVDGDAESKVEKLIALNPTVKRLKIGYGSFYCVQYNAIYLIDRYLYKLGHAKIDNIFRHRYAQKEQFEKCLKQLSRWDSLKTLTLPLDDFAIFFLNELAKANVPIGCLTLNCAAIANEMHRAYECVQMRLSEGYIIELVNKIPHLEELHLMDMMSPSITATGIQNITENFGKLSHLEVDNRGDLEDIQIEMDNYQLMLKAIQSRPKKIQLSISHYNKMEINVPEEVLLVNREWLTFIKKGF